MITDKLITIRKLLPEDIEGLRHAATEDNHILLFPTHVVIKDGQYIGYFSIASIPLTEFWMHSTKSSPRDSSIAIKWAESLVNERGHSTVITCIGSNSNFRPVIEKHFGYNKIYDTSIFIKQLIHMDEQGKVIVP
jgi:hypothetical protein